MKFNEKINFSSTEMELSVDSGAKSYTLAVKPSKLTPFASLHLNFLFTKLTTFTPKMIVGYIEKYDLCDHFKINDLTCFSEGNHTLKTNKNLSLLQYVELLSNGNEFKIIYDSSEQDPLTLGCMVVRCINSKTLYLIRDTGYTDPQFNNKDIQIKIIENLLEEGNFEFTRVRNQKPINLHKHFLKNYDVDYDGQCHYRCKHTKRVFGMEVHDNAVGSMFIGQNTTVRVLLKEIHPSLFSSKVSYSISKFSGKHHNQRKVELIDSQISFMDSKVTNYLNWFEKTFIDPVGYEFIIEEDSEVVVNSPYFLVCKCLNTLRWFGLRRVRKVAKGKILVNVEEIQDRSLIIKFGDRNV